MTHPESNPVSSSSWRQSGSGKPPRGGGPRKHHRRPTTEFNRQRQAAETSTSHISPSASITSPANSPPQNEASIAVACDRIKEATAALSQNNGAPRSRPRVGPSGGPNGGPSGGPRNRSGGRRFDRAGAPDSDSSSVHPAPVGPYRPPRKQVPTETDSVLDVSSHKLSPKQDATTLALDNPAPPPSLGAPVKSFNWADSDSEDGSAPSPSPVLATDRSKQSWAEMMEKPSKSAAAAKTGLAPASAKQVDPKPSVSSGALQDTKGTSRDVDALAGRLGRDLTIRPEGSQYDKRKAFKDTFNRGSSVEPKDGKFRPRTNSHLMRRSPEKPRLNKHAPNGSVQAPAPPTKEHVHPAEVLRSFKPSRRQPERETVMVAPRPQTTSASPSVSTSEGPRTRPTVNLGVARRLILNDLGMRAPRSRNPDPKGPKGRRGGCPRDGETRPTVN